MTSFFDSTAIPDAEGGRSTPIPYTLISHTTTTSMTARIATLLALPLVLAACGDTSPADDMDAGAADTPQPSAETSAPERSVTIEAPAAGDTVPAGSVEIVLSVDGIQVVPAGDSTPNSGHHHLFLDADVSPAGEPIPAVEGSIVHIGDGSSTYTFENVAPGEHRVIAVLGDWQHVPLDPMVSDTIVFFAR